MFDSYFFFFFFFNDTATTEIYTLSLHDALPICENPLDVGPTVGVQAGKFAEICKVVCADPTVDLVTVQGLMPVNPGDRKSTRLNSSHSQISYAVFCLKKKKKKKTHT